MSKIRLGQRRRVLRIDAIKIGKNEVGHTLAKRSIESLDEAIAESDKLIFCAQPVSE